MKMESRSGPKLKGHTLGALHNVPHSLWRLRMDTLWEKLRSVLNQLDNVVNALWLNEI